MARQLRSKLTYANVLATIAIFVALGGSSYAALSLPKNSVKANQIAKNAVRAAEIRAGAVRSSEVRNRSLRAGDFALGQLPAGPRGETGPTGPTGPAGPTAGAADGSYESQPANPITSVVLQDAQITMPTAGRIFAQASVRTASASCTFSGGGGLSGNCGLWVSLYVDGQPIPKTAESFGSSAACNGCGSFNSPIQNNTADHFSLFGVSGTLSAGTHDIQLVGDLVAQANNANTTGSVGPNAPSANAIVGGIALGG